MKQDCIDCQSQKQRKLIFTRNQSTNLFHYRRTVNEKITVFLVCQLACRFPVRILQANSFFLSFFPVWWGLCCLSGWIHALKGLSGWQTDRQLVSLMMIPLWDSTILTLKAPMKKSCTGKLLPLNFPTVFLAEYKFPPTLENCLYGPDCDVLVFYWRLYAYLYFLDSLAASAISLHAKLSVDKRRWSLLYSVIIYLTEYFSFSKL